MENLSPVFRSHNLTTSGGELHMGPGVCGQIRLNEIFNTGKEGNQGRSGQVCKLAQWEGRKVFVIEYSVTSVTRLQSQ